MDRSRNPATRHVPALPFRSRYKGSLHWMPASSALDSAAVRNMIHLMGGYAMGQLLDASGRQQLRDRVSDRLRERRAVNVQYAEQAILANLDWGIDGLDKAMKATNPETRAARLEHTEKMLQVAVLLDPKRFTAGVPNSYLSAWANLYMALVWKLRNNDRNVALHLLDMFLIEPYRARRDFAPALWEQLFRPHMANIEAWFESELDQIMTTSSPLSITSASGILPTRKSSQSRSNSQDSSSQSRSFSKSQEESAGFESNISVAANVEIGTAERPERDDELQDSATGLAPDQIMKRELLHKLYQDSLDENTLEYAQYFKDWMASDTADRNSPGDDDSTQTASNSWGMVDTLGSAPVERSSGMSEGHALATGQLSNTDAENEKLQPDKDEMQALQEQVAQLRQPVLDPDLDSFTEASFLDALAYSRDSSIEEVSYIQTFGQEAMGGDVETRREEKIEKGDGSTDHRNDGIVNVVGKNAFTGDKEDGLSFGEFGNGAGIYLDEEELSEDELLQVWEEMSEGRIGFQEANDFISRLTDEEGRPIDFRKLSETADTIKAYRMSQKEIQPDVPPESAQLVENQSSLDSDSLSSKYSSSPHSDVEEEAEVKIRQEFDRPDSPDTLSRMNSQSSRSSLSIRKSIFQQSLQYREQSQSRPPKDFVCSITNQLFQDPVTLETGQTYERRAIQEWLDRGSNTCPITRQTLKNPKLPNTNYVLKRLVDNWKDDYHQYVQEISRGEALTQTPSRFGRVGEQELKVFEGSQSPSTRFNRPSIKVGEAETPIFDGGRNGNHLKRATSGDDISPASLEGILKQLRSVVDTLIRTHDPVQCERAVLVGAHIWEESRCAASVATSLSRAGVVEGMMEVLSSSTKDEILRSVVCLLSDLISKNEVTRHTILRVDPEAESIASVLKNANVPQVAVLLYLLRIPATQVSALKLVPSLLSVVKNSDVFGERTFSTTMNPKAAAVYILEQLVTTLDHRTNMANAEAIVMAEGVPSLMDRLETNVLEEKVSAVAVLWSCLQSNGGCRMLMVQHLKMSTLIELLHNSKEQARTVAIFFLAELIRLNRRRVIEKVLRDVLQEGFLNSMHVLMLHLQMSPLEHRPLVASLLLQLDLLAEPQKHSIYRDEAVEALVEALTSELNPKLQLEAAKALVSLSGRYAHTGKSLTEACLLKTFGLDDDIKRSCRFDQAQQITETDQSLEDEEQAADNWDRRMTLALLRNGRSLIGALGGAIPSKSPKLSRPCVVATAWLLGPLRQMADSNLISYARNCLLSPLLLTLQTGHDIEMRVLGCSGLYNLTDDTAGIQKLAMLSKDLVGPLRRLRRHTWTAKRILEALIANSSVDVNVDMWAHGEVGQLDASQSGEARAMIYSRGYIYSGHADASIKIWVVRRRMPKMVQEVREHTRAVLCLTSLEKQNKLFSGSADKTVRIWATRDERVKCLQVIDLEEAVHSVAVNASFICVVPQGLGLKVLDSEGDNAKILNANKHVQSIAFDGQHVYCGCTDNSIQEIDPTTGTSITLQYGSKSLKGKRAIYSIQMLNSQLFAGGMTVEGIAVKIWRVSTKSLVSSIATQIDVRLMAVSEDLIYLGSNLLNGVIEVWSQKTYQKVASFTVGCKVLSMALVGETLFTGSADGKLRAWALV